MGLVHKQCVDAQLIEVYDVFQRMAVAQFVDFALQGAFRLLLVLALTAADTPSGASRRLRFLHLFQLLLILLPDNVRIVLDHIEAALRDDDNVPFACGDPSEEAFALLLDEVVFRGDQDVRGRVQLRRKLRKLLQRGVLHHDHGLCGELQADQFHGRRDHDGGFSRANRMGQQGISFDAARDSPFLMIAQLEILPVDPGCRARIDVIFRDLVSLQDMAVEHGVIHSFHLPGQLRIVHHEVMEPVHQFVFVLPCRQCRLFVHDLIIVMSIGIPHTVLDDRILQIQNHLQQLDRVHMLHVVLIQKLPVHIIRADHPAVQLGIVADIHLRRQVLADPVHHDLRGQPEGAQREIDVFDGQRFRQNLLQCFGVCGQTMAFRFQQFRLDIA